MKQHALFAPPDTLALERERLLRERVKPGGTCCGACGRKVAQYSRSMNAGQAKALAWIVERQRGDEFVDVQGRADADILRAKDYGQLAHWGLLEAKTSADPSVKGSGWWRATTLGRDFVAGIARVHAHAVIYDGVLLRLEGERVGIDDVKAHAFDVRDVSGRKSA